MVAFTFTKLDGSSRTIDEETLKDTGEVITILKDEFLKLLGDKDIRVSKGKGFVADFFNSYMEWGESTESDSDRKKLRKDISKAYFEALEETTFRELLFKPDFKGGLEIVLAIAKGKKSERYFDEELDELLNDEYKRKIMGLIDAYDRAPETLLENAKWRNRAAKNYISKVQKGLKTYISRKLVAEVGDARNNAFKPIKGKIDPLMIVKFKDKDGTIKSISFESRTELDKNKIRLFDKTRMKQELVKKKIEAFDDASDFYEHEEVLIPKPEIEKIKNTKIEYAVLNYEDDYNRNDLFNDLKKLREEQYNNASVIKIPIFGVPKLLGGETNGEKKAFKLRDGIIDMIRKTYMTMLADISTHTNDVYNMDIQIQLAGGMKGKNVTLLTGVGTTQEFKRIERIIQEANIEEAEETDSKTKTVELKRVRKGDAKAKKYLEQIVKESDKLIKDIETKIDSLDIDKKYLDFSSRIDSLIKQIKSLSVKAKTNAKKEDLLEESDLEILYSYGRLKAILDKGLPTVEKAIKDIYKKEGLSSMKLILESTKEDAMKEADSKKNITEKERKEIVQKAIQDKEEDIRYILSSALKPAINYGVKRNALVEQITREGITPSEASARLSLTPEEYAKIKVKEYKSSTDKPSESEAKKVEEDAKKQQIARQYYKDNYFEDADKIRNKINSEGKNNNVLSFNVQQSGDMPLSKVGGVNTVIFIVDSRQGKDKTKYAKLVDKENNIFVVPKSDLVEEAKEKIGDIIFDDSGNRKFAKGDTINIVLSGVGSLPVDLAEGELNKVTLANRLTTPSKPVDARTIILGGEDTRRDFEDKMSGTASLSGGLGISEKEQKDGDEEDKIDIMYTIIADRVSEYTIEPKQSDVGTYREEYDSVERDKDGKEKKRTRVKGRVKSTLNAEARKKADRQVDESIGFISLLLNKFRITRRL